MSAPEKLRILILTADPKDHPQPALSREVRIVKDELSRLPKRVRIDVASSVTPELFVDFLEDYKPHVLHFAGHGNNRGEPYLLGADDEGLPVPARTLRGMLAKASDLRFIFLNACNSARVAQELALQLPVVAVGHAAVVEDTLLRRFAERLYRSIAKGGSLGGAVADACALLESIGPNNHDIGQINSRHDVDADDVILLPSQPSQPSQPGPERQPAAAAAGPRVSPEDQAALCQLLLSLFDAEEFRRLLRFNSATAALVAELPTSGAPTELFARAVELLVRRDLLDRSFFAWIQRERPNRKDILPIQQRFTG